MNTRITDAGTSRGQAQLDRYCVRVPAIPACCLLLIPSGASADPTSPRDHRPHFHELFFHSPLPTLRTSTHPHNHSTTTIWPWVAWPSLLAAMQKAPQRPTARVRAPLDLARTGTCRMHTQVRSTSLAYTRRRSNSDDTLVPTTPSATLGTPGRPHPRTSRKLGLLALFRFQVGRRSLSATITRTTVVGSRFDGQTDQYEYSRTCSHTVAYAYIDWTDLSIR